MLYSGTVVDVDRNEWSLNGRTGVTYTIYVKEDGGARYAPQGVRVEPEQFGLFSVGDVVELPVLVTVKNPFDGQPGRAKLQVKLVPEYAGDAKKSKLSPVASHAATGS